VNSAPNVGILVPHREEQDMARRRGQRTGWLRPENGSWLLTYRAYVWDQESRKTKPQRLTVKIGPAPDPPTRRTKNGELTEKQAERFAWDHYLKKLDNATVKPLSTMTIEHFWEQRYKLHLDRRRKFSTRSQYKSLWKVWIQPGIGNVRMFELKPDQVDAVVQQALDAKKGTETAKHIKKVISSIIEFARKKRMFTGENPAHLVELPDSVPVRRPHSMTIEQCREWFAAVRDVAADPKDRRSDARPIRTMSLFEVCCSLGPSEQLGLRWKHLNLTDTAALFEGDRMEPFSAAVRENCYHGRGGSLKTKHRLRNIPLPKVLVEALIALRASSKWTGPEDPVFAGQTGKPLWTDNLQKRALKPRAIELNMPWLSWNVMRHTCATLLKDLGMNYVDRRALMGHSDETMTDRYTHGDGERMRAGVELLASEITKPPTKNEPEATGASRANVVEIRKPIRAAGNNSDQELTWEASQALDQKAGAS
jgi:integrase